jgi:hypothetical protein
MIPVLRKLLENLGLFHLKKSQKAPGSAACLEFATAANASANGEANGGGVWRESGAGSESATTAKASANGEANGGGVLRESEADDEGATLDAGSNVSNDSMQELEELLTKLNSLAKEFIPPSHSDASSAALAASIP